MGTEVILGKIERARARIDHANRLGSDCTALSAVSWLADALEDIVMTMRAKELKENRQQEAAGDDQPSGEWEWLGDLNDPDW